MLRRLSFSVVFVCLFFASIVSAKPVYTSEQCLEFAKTRNPAVLASFERRERAQSKKKAVFDDFLPKLNVDYSYTRFNKENTINSQLQGVGDITTRVEDNFAMTISVDQPLFTGFRLTDRYQLADLGLKSAVAGEELAGLEITYQTLRAYYTLLMAEKLQKVAEEATTQLSSHLRDSEQFFKNEIIPLNNLLESKVYLANAEQDARIAESQTRVARMALATIIQEPLTSEFGVVDAPDTMELENPVEELIVQALEMRPELKRANYRQESTKTSISLAKSSFYPTIMLSARHNRYGDDFLVDGDGVSDIQIPEESMIGVYATWEIFAWGQTVHNVNAARAADREVKQLLRSVIDTITLEVQDNYTYTLTSYGNIEATAVAVEQAKENLRMTEVRYRNQIGTNTDVLDARTLLTTTETNYYQAVYQYNIGLAGLARAVGVENREQFGLQTKD